ncbi:MAG: chemotaxis protein CheD [Pseudobutyrivibrio sp.]|nr:chemotaxis protein CheD [Pseudobutyrivibrio sp.]
MSQMIKVGMADLNICKAPDALTTIGLGSCIGIALYDPTTKISGLAHIMLPDSTQIRNNSNGAKFADTGIQMLLDDMIKAGANKSKIVAKIAGGAKMFEMSGGSASTINVGQRNAEASKQKLKELGIKLLAEDTGLNYGRTVELYSETGEYHIKSVGKDLKIL